MEDDGKFAIHPDKILYSATSENGAVLYVCDWAILVFVWEYVCVSADPPLEEILTGHVDM